MNFASQRGLNRPRADRNHQDFRIETVFSRQIQIFQDIDRRHLNVYRSTSDGALWAVFAPKPMKARVARSSKKSPSHNRFSQDESETGILKLSVPRFHSTGSKETSFASRTFHSAKNKKATPGVLGRTWLSSKAGSVAIVEPSLRSRSWSLRYTTR